MAIARDPVGGRVGLWQGRLHIGCPMVNEPGSLDRTIWSPPPPNTPGVLPAVFDYTLDRNEDMVVLYAKLGLLDRRGAEGALQALHAAGRINAELLSASLQELS